MCYRCYDPSDWQRTQSMPSLLPRDLGYIFLLPWLLDDRRWHHQDLTMSFQTVSESFFTSISFCTGIKCVLVLPWRDQKTNKCVGVCLVWAENCLFRGNEVWTRIVFNSAITPGQSSPSHTLFRSSTDCHTKFRSTSGLKRRRRSTQGFWRKPHLFADSDKWRKLLRARTRTSLCLILSQNLASGVTSINHLCCIFNHKYQTQIKFTWKITAIFGLF